MLILPQESTPLQIDPEFSCPASCGAGSRYKNPYIHPKFPPASEVLHTVYGKRTHTRSYHGGSWSGERLPHFFVPKICSNHIGSMLRILVTIKRQMFEAALPRNAAMPRDRKSWPTPGRGRSFWPRSSGSTRPGSPIRRSWSGRTGPCPWRNLQTGWPA